ncbi:LysR family transcriptional regulator [Streptomyces sp. NPDC007861]|uniref:LysR family transcriptional regulator n=1 Tax=Streptomyces sp. NPDC007861 TaxID=3154893 RepID=UPI003403EBA4
MIDVNRLRVLQAVSRHGSLARAAAALHVTTSAVSQQIAALERSAGLPLVERSSRGTRLTEPGRVLVETAAVVEAELRGATHHLERLSRGEVGRFGVATFASAGQRLLPGPLASVMGAFPGVEVSVEHGEPEQVLPLLASGDADLALVYRFTPAPEKDTVGRWTPLCADPVHAVLPAAHPLADRTEVELAALAGERWIQGTGIVNDMLVQHAAAAGFVPRATCESTDYVLMYRLVAAGAGVALIPDLALPAEPSDGAVVVPLTAPRPVRHVYAVTPRHAWPNPVVTTLVTQLRKAAGQAVPHSSG